MVDTPLPGDASADPTSGADRPPHRARIEGRDLEEVTARRVERAELVRSIRERRGEAAAEDADAAADAGEHVERLDREALAAAAAGERPADLAPDDEPEDLPTPQTRGEDGEYLDVDTDPTEVVEHAGEQAEIEPAEADQPEAPSEAPEPDAEARHDGARHDDQHAADAPAPAIRPLADDPEPPTAALPVLDVAPQASEMTDAVPAALARLAAWREAADEAQRTAEQAVFEASSARARDAADPSGDLDRALREPDGERFLLDLLDDVVRPDDAIARGNGLGDLSQRLPLGLRRRTRRALRIGALVGPGLPWVAVRAIGSTTRGVFGDEVVLDVDPEARSAALASAREHGALIRALPLGRRILGEQGLRERLARCTALAEEPHVDELDLDLASLEPALDLWDMDGVVERLAARVAPIVHLGASLAQPRRVMLRVSRSEHLELGVAVLQRLIALPELRDAQLGLTIPAAFPESIGLARRLAGLAHLRREDLGAPIILAVTREASIGRERIAAAEHGWALASFASEEEVDASVARLLDLLLDPEHANAVRVELDSPHWRDQALALSLAEARRLLASLRIVLPWGERAEALGRLADSGCQLVLRAPLAPDATLRAAVPYLVGRVRAKAAALAGLERTAILPRGARAASRDADGGHPDDIRLLDAVGSRGALATGPLRSQERVDADDAATVTAGIELELFPAGIFADDDPGYERVRESGGRMAADRAAAPGSALPELEGNPAESGPLPGLTQVVLGLRRGRILRNTFRHAPATDPSIPANREWGLRIQRRVARSELGIAEAEHHRVRSAEQIEDLLASAKAASGPWGERPGWERAAVLEKVAKALEANRARLIETVMSESGTPFNEVDHELSRVIDFASHSAHLARQLDRMQGAAFSPVGISLVVPSGIANLSASASSTFGALAAGSAVILQPEPGVMRAHAVFARVLWDAELPQDLVQLAVCDDDRFSDEALSRELVTDRRVERVLLTGEWEAARDMLRWRKDLPLIGGASGKNAMIVAPSADLEDAAWDIVRSAFVGTGQTPAHLSTVILVGSLGRSERFLELLADAAASIRVGYPSDPSAIVGPLARPATGQIRYALGELGEGESWLVEPRQLDDTGRLWTPGIRLGVQPGSFVHTTGFAAPVIGVMTALTLDEAIRMQNATAYGLSAGLHSRDRTEIAEWIRRVEAGNLYVNRDLLGNQVQRMPFGGWKRSNVGTRYKSGGPNQLISLGSWRPDHGEQSQTLHLRGLEPRARELIEAAQTHLAYEEFEVVRRSALSDQIAWNEEFGEAADVTSLPFERNLLRYVPVPATIRVQEGAELAELVRLLVASQIARSRRVDLTTGIEVPAPLRTLVEAWGITVRDETDAAFLARLEAGGGDSLRIRLVGGGRGSVCQALGADADASVWSDPVTPAGRVELLPFLREQSISLRAHRFGEPDDLVAELFPHEKLVDPSAPISDPGNPVHG